MTRAELIAYLREGLAADDAIMTAMRADKPTVTDGHSDGKRVRYARTETRRETVAAILSMLESAS